MNLSTKEALFDAQTRRLFPSDSAKTLLDKAESQALADGVPAEVVAIAASFNRYYGTRTVVGLEIEIAKYSYTWSHGARE